MRDIIEVKKPSQLWCFECIHVIVIRNLGMPVNISITFTIHGVIGYNDLMNIVSHNSNAYSARHGRKFF